MNTGAVDSLTQRQRECLRLVARDRDAKEIGRQLGISPQTVNNHVKAAMATLGVNSRFVAARLLASFESHSPPMASLPKAMANDIGYTAIVPSLDEGVQEERGRYDPRRAPSPAWEKTRRYALSPVQRLLSVALLTAVVAVIIVAALPMSDSVQRLANWLDPPVNHR